MKKLIKSIVVPALIVLLTFTSCQDEIDVEGPETSSEENIEANSETANLIVQTSSNDGSSDNIVDGASCISIVFPITVNANGQEVVLNSQEDLANLEAIFDESPDDEDSLEIIFPITVVTEDFTEIVVNRPEELIPLIENCIEGGDDEDIECIDFQFPITFFSFNTETQETNRIIVENDQELHELCSNIEEDEVLSIQYPVTLVLFDGTEIVVNSNEELETALLEARAICDEDDDDDFNDDDFTKERLDALLLECPLSISSVIVNDINISNDFENFFMNFSEDGSVIVSRVTNDVSDVGTWNTRITDRGAILELEFENFISFNMQWLVSEIGDERIQLLSEERDDRVVLRQNCNDIDFTSERVEGILQECLWRIARLQIDGTDREEEYIGTPFNFQEQGVVTLRVNGELVQGTWDVLEANSSFALQLTFDNRPELNLLWLIVELEEDRVILISETSQLVLRRFCEEEQDGDVLEVRNILNEGEWGVLLYLVNQDDLAQEFTGFAIDFLANGALLVEGNNEIIDGSWLVRRDDDYLKLDLNFGLEPPFNELNNNWKIVEITSDVIELRNYGEDGDSVEILVLERL